MKYAVKYRVIGTKTAKAKIFDVGEYGNEKDAERDFREWAKDNLKKQADIITIVLYGN